jgi:hypothetical protein
MATKYKSLGHLGFLTQKPVGLTFLKSLAFRRLFEQKVGSQRQWIVEVEAKKLKAFVIAAKRDLRKQLSMAEKDNKDLLTKLAKLADENTKLIDVNSKLHGIVERLPDDAKVKSGYKSPLGDAASRAASAWPLLPGNFEGGRRR